MTNSEEAWLPIADTPDYEVSNHGRVRSWKPQFRGMPRPAEARILSPGLNDSGYAYVMLCGDNGVRLLRKIHRLVAEAFCPGRSDLNYLVRHNNDDRRNNRWDNLTWGTKSQNMEDRYRLGSAPYGERHPRSKLSDAAVLEIFNDATSTCKALAEKHGVCPMVISNIRKRKIKRRILGAGPPSPGACGSGRNPKTTITPKDATDVFVSSLTHTEEARRLGVSATTILRIRQRKLWRRATARLPDRFCLPSMPQCVDLPAHPLPPDASIAAAAPLPTAQ